MTTKPITVTTRISPELFERLRKMAYERRESQAAIVQKALDHWLSSPVETKK